MILDRFKVTDKVAIVTGAGRGIGRGIALALAEAGADVVCAARSIDQLEDTASEIRGRGRRCLVVPTDVTERPQLEALVEAAMGEFGRIDILVNNAGGWPPQPLLRTSEKAFEQAFRFNVTSAFLMTRFAVPHMVETAGAGAIVNISSRAGSMVQAGFTSYGTSKAALSFMTKMMAPELAPKVRVNAIEVGGVETDALATRPDRRQHSARAREQHADAARGSGRGHRGGRVVPGVTSVVVGDRQGLRGRWRRRVTRLHDAVRAALAASESRSPARPSERM